MFRKNHHLIDSIHGTVQHLTRQRGKNGFFRVRVGCKISFLLSFKTFWTSFSTFRVVADGPVQGFVVSREVICSQSSWSSFSVSLFMIKSYCRQFLQNSSLILKICFPNLLIRKFALQKTLSWYLEDVYLVQLFSRKCCFLFFMNSL